MWPGCHLLITALISRLHTYSDVHVSFVIIAESADISLHQVFFFLTGRCMLVFKTAPVISAASSCVSSLVNVQSNVSDVHCVIEISSKNKQKKSIKVALFTLGDFIKNN